MSDGRVRLTIRRGEDYSAYIHWVDYRDNPVPVDPGSTALLQARDVDGAVVASFSSDNDPEQASSLSILGRSGIIRITSPRHVTRMMPVGRFDFDLLVQHTDADAAVFRGGQRKYLVTGDFVVAETITKMPN